MGVYDIRHIVDNTLRCSSCGEVKAPDEFHNSNSASNTSKRAYCCKSCVSKKQSKRNMTEAGYKANLWQNLKGNAKRRGISVEIEKSDIDKLFKSQSGLCAVTGMPMQFSALDIGKNSYAVSVDRIDNDLGYTRSNIRLVCARVNLMKMELSDDQMMFWCLAILKGSDK